MDNGTISQSSPSDDMAVSFEWRERARRHYEAKGKHRDRETGKIGPFTPKEMQEDMPSGDWATGPRRGKDCCPEQKPDAEGKHE
jgi:hypothetical protein